MKTLLTAYWTHLLSASYETDKSFLAQYLPANTELNDWNGKYLMSLVAFLFEKPNFCGFPSPIYRSFEEINLRFYVRRKENNTWKNGVVFIKEIAPAYLIGQAAKWLYKEHFIHLPMKHDFRHTGQSLQTSYSCKLDQEWQTIALESCCQDSEPAPESMEYFIREHYWGYTRASANKTSEFKIEHRPWKIFNGTQYCMNLDTGKIYGDGFQQYFSAPPLSCFLMDGSLTKVSWPVLL